MIIKHQIILIGLCFLFSSNVLAQDVVAQLRAEVWDTQRHGEALLKVPALSAIIQKWMLAPSQLIELRYPGGEEGELWVEELHDWFVSLGVPSTKIQILPGSQAEDIINIVLIKPVEKNE